MRLSSMASRAGRLASISATARSHNGFLLVLCAALLAAPATRTLAQQIPDIIVFVTDDEPQHEQDAMPLVNSLLGPPAGVRFERGLVHASLCAPSRATLLTGLYVAHHGLHTNNLVDMLKFDPSSTYAVWLQAAGYRTGLFGKYLKSQSDDGQLPVPPGWDVFRTTGVASSPSIAKEVVDFIRATPADRPLLLHVGWRQPHYPARPLAADAGDFAGLTPWRPPSFDEADVSDKPAWVQALPRVTTADADSLDAFHERQVESLQGVDRGVRNVLAALNAAGRRHRVVFFVSDNGLALGEHRKVASKNCVYEECLRTPFLVYAPDALPRGDSTHVVSLVDVAPTIAEYARVTPQHAVDGESLRPLVRDGAAVWPKATLHEVGFDDSHAQAVRTARWKYVELVKTGERELYDLVTDPWELENKAGDPAHAAVQDSLAAQLAEMRR